MAETGCTKSISSEELAVIKLNEKYNQEFAVEEVVGDHIIDGYYTALAYQVDEPTMLFRVNVDSDGKGESDNYVSKLLGKELSDRIGQNVAGLDGIFNIYSELMYDPYDLADPDMTLEDYFLNDPEMRYRVYFHYCPENVNDEELYRELQKAFDGLESINGKIYLYIVDEGMLKNIQNYLESNDKAYDDYHTMLSPYFKGGIDIEKGKILKTLDEFKQMMN